MKPTGSQLWTGAIWRACSGQMPGKTASTAARKAGHLSPVTGDGGSADMSARLVNSLGFELEVELLVFESVKNQRKV